MVSFRTTLLGLLLFASPLCFAQSLTFSQTKPQFGLVALGKSSASLVISVSNSSIAALSIQQIMATQDFVQANDCPPSLAAGSACSISVTFTPLGAGPRNGQLYVVSAEAGAESIQLNGIGLPLHITPSQLDFGVVPVSQTSAVSTIKLTNGGTEAVSISGITTSGDFSQTNDCGASIEAGATCTVSVTFTPQASGSSENNLLINTAKPSLTSSRRLHGTGKTQ